MSEEFVPVFKFYRTEVWQPTPYMRWMPRPGEPNQLQQLWHCAQIGEQEWREIPTVPEEPQ